eukprot:3880403-Pleurochrysis_carterae.AAC.1
MAARMLKRATLCVAVRVAARGADHRCARVHAHASLVRARPSLRAFVLVTSTPLVQVCVRVGVRVPTLLQTRMCVRVRCAQKSSTFARLVACRL